MKRAPFVITAFVVLLTLGPFFSVMAITPQVVIDRQDVPYSVFVNKGTVYYALFRANSTVGSVMKISTLLPNPEAVLDGIPQPYAIALDSKGDLYFTTRTGLFEVLKVGEKEPTVLSKGTGRIYGLYFDNNDDLYLAKFGSPISRNTGSIERFSASTIGVNASSQVLLTGVDHPIGIAVDGQGSVYFAENGLNGTIKKLEPNGKVSELATNISVPSGLAVDSDGNVYFASTTGSVKRIEKDSSQITTLADGLNDPWGLFFSRDDNKLYVAEKSVNGRILAFDIKNFVSKTVVSSYDDGYITPALVAAILLLIAVPATRWARSRPVSRKKKWATKGKP